ncbi:MAG: uracil-DNA glycosylase [Verrucomicrobiae bacterium]|nr:uracil-DNA glycosylase [Verrucomicrobiae bacterium]
MPRWWTSLCGRVVSCRQCPRLVAWREQVARQKKPAYRDWEYWGRPVPGWGDPKARLLIIGLAPAAHGANRTGRMFTGDQSGRWLYRALYRAGFANQPTWEHRNDGLMLRDCYVTAVLRCAPPGNKPLPREIERCQVFLREELQRLTRVQVVIALGRIAFETYSRLRGLTPRPAFAHNRRYDGRPVLIASYHPSRQNTNTGKLTEAMFDAVFAQVRKVLSEWARR